ncbi:NikM domain containing protein [Flammeovirga sp. SJP92]|nr:NikM domain containing protein [Flammeovirga sp. SJP92]
MDSYFLKPHQEAIFSLYNGTFEESENTIARHRMEDASVVAHGNRTAINEGQWKDQDSTITQLPFKAGEAGTYVIGISTKVNSLKQTAEDFNGYLKHDGVLDMLKERTETNTLNEDVNESYEKHVKAIYQVGDKKTEDWKTVLGYPIEFVPVSNPYEKYSGQTLDVKLLLEGQPLANQLVYADFVKSAHGHSHNDHGHHHDHHGNHSHDHEHGTDHTHTNGEQLRTNAEGIVTVKLPEDGIYYLRTIHMAKVDKGDITHESKWSTLTFEVTHQHGSHTHTHDDHEHHHDDELPTWVFILGSIAIIGVLFMVFRTKE